MGTWGYSITENDTALDVYGDYIDRLNAGLSQTEIERVLREEFGEALADEDDAVNVELAIAKAQWDCGHVTPATIDRIEALINSDAGMALWEESGTKAAAKRRKVLGVFLAKLRTTNPRPKKPRKPVLRKPIFSPGDCLALKHPTSGKYAAAIVLLSPIEHPRPGQDTYGVNCVGFLDYYAGEVPTAQVFERREWLYVEVPYRKFQNHWIIAVDHANAQLWAIGKRKSVIEKLGHTEVSVVGKTNLRDNEGLEETFSASWSLTTGFERIYDRYAAAKLTPDLHRWRSTADFLAHHPDFQEELLKIGMRHEQSVFDLTPLG
jgi:hypothetical protein